MSKEELKKLTRWELHQEMSKTNDVELISAIVERLEEMDAEDERFIMLASKTIGN